MNGIRFKCAKCGRCCINETDSISVHLFLNDIKAISLLTGMDERAMVAQYCNVVRDHFIFSDCTVIVPRIELKKKKDGSCVFLNNNLCGIYANRPFLCKTGPFHSGYMHNEIDFLNFKASCCGIGRGKLYTGADIEKLLNDEQIKEDKYENDIISDELFSCIFNTRMKNRKINIGLTYDDYLNEGNKDIIKILYVNITK